MPIGTKLTVVTGDKTYSSSGTVISGKDFHGFVKITGSNITIKNSIFRGRATSSNAGLLDTERGTNTVVQDSEFVPSHPSATIDGIWANSTKIYRANVHGSVDGIKTGSDVLIQDSYIHDLSWFASDPNQGGGETHNDGVQSFHGDARVTIRHNTIDMSTTKNANAAWQTSARDSRIEGNWLDGGGCTLNFNHVSGYVDGVVRDQQPVRPPLLLQMSDPAEHPVIPRPELGQRLGRHGQTHPASAAPRLIAVASEQGSVSEPQVSGLARLSSRATGRFTKW